MSTTTIHQTIFTVMKSKIASLEQRVRELEEENMALHLFKALVCDNDDLDNLDYDDVKQTDDEASVVANMVETMVDIIEMTHTEVATQNEDEQVNDASWECEPTNFYEWRNRCILMNEEFEYKIWRGAMDLVVSDVKQLNAKKKKGILFRFAKKVVQGRRQRIQQERDLDPALDLAIEIPYRVQLDAWKRRLCRRHCELYVGMPWQRKYNEEIVEEEVADEEDETTYDIAQRITLKINELKTSSKTTSPL